MASQVSSQIKRVQYTLEDKSPSSLTIDRNIYNALDKKFGDANEWCKKTALEVRTMLQDEALELQKKGDLIKIDNLGNKLPMTIEEYVRGKVSSGIRNIATREVIDEKYL